MFESRAIPLPDNAPRVRQRLLEFERQRVVLALRAARALRCLFKVWDSVFHLLGSPRVVEDRDRVDPVELQGRRAADVRPLGQSQHLLQEEDGHRELTHLDHRLRELEHVVAALLIRKLQLVAAAPAWKSLRRPSRASAPSSRRRHRNNVASLA